MLESFPEEIQLVLLFLGIGLLFVLVVFNNRRNRRKRDKFRDRDFRKKYFEKKKKD